MSKFTTATQSFFTEREVIIDSIISHLRILLQVCPESVQPLPLAGKRIHPNLNFVEILPYLDPDAVHDVNELVLGANHGKDRALPQLIASLLVDFELQTSSPYVVYVLPHRLHSLLEQVYIAVLLSSSVLESSLVDFKNWKSSQNSLMSVMVETSFRLDEYSSVLILSMSCTHKVKLLDNLKLIINLQTPITTMHLIRTSKFMFSQPGRLFVFAGQGTQEKGMLSSIPQPKVSKANSIAKQLIGLDLQEISNTDSKNLMNQTQVTQPLLLLSHYLHFQQRIGSGLAPQDIMVGHSLGQFSALVNAKSLSLEDGLKLVHLRGTLMKKHTLAPHGMLIIKYKQQKQGILMDEIAKHQLEVACINSKTNVIVAGEKQKIAQLSKQLKKSQISSMSLPVSTAFHCKMLNSMVHEFRQILQKTHFQPPLCKIIRNYDCKLYTSPSDIRQGLLLQLTNPVQFYKSILCVDKGAQVVEVGHKRWISRFVDEIRCDM